jgi:hypothetical protein
MAEFGALGAGEANPEGVYGTDDLHGGCRQGRHKGQALLQAAKQVVRIRLPHAHKPCYFIHHTTF